MSLHNGIYHGNKKSLYIGPRSLGGIITTLKADIEIKFYPFKVIGLGAVNINTFAPFLSLAQ